MCCSEMAATFSPAKLADNVFEEVVTYHQAQNIIH